MIQPINTVSSKVYFKGSQRSKNKLNESEISLINATGVAAAVGGITTIVTRCYTNSFAHAGVLGIFGAFLTMFFMTPYLIDKIGADKLQQNASSNNATKQNVQEGATSLKKNNLKSIRKFVQFRAEQS